MNNPIVIYDDGREIFLDSFSGGASKEGHFGTLTLRFTKPNGEELVRKYVALDYLYSVHDELLGQYETVADFRTRMKFNN